MPKDRDQRASSSTPGTPAGREDAADPLGRKTPLPRAVVVVGCGRLGALLAGHLSSAGSNVVVIDRKETAFERLPREFSGFRVHGDAGEIAVLKSAEIERAECLLATTENDNVNLLVAQVARAAFHVPHVVARIFDPSREKIYEDFGIRAINPTRLAAEAFLRELAEIGQAQREP